MSGLGELRQTLDGFIGQLRGVLQGMSGLASIKLRPVRIEHQQISGAIGEQIELNLDGVAKFSIENKTTGQSAYIDDTQGIYSGAVDIPNGEVREYAAPTGGVFTGTKYISFGTAGASAGTALLIKQIPQ